MPEGTRNSEHSLGILAEFHFAAELATDEEVTALPGVELESSIGDVSIYQRKSDIGVQTRPTFRKDSAARLRQTWAAASKVYRGPVADGYSDTPFKTFNDPYQTERGVQGHVVVDASPRRPTDRHEVGQCHFTGLRGKNRPEDIGRAQVLPGDMVMVFRANAQEATFSCVEEAAEGRVGIEAAKAAPIHAAMARDQCRAMAVADHRVVADRGICFVVQGHRASQKEQISGRLQPLAVLAQSAST